MKILYAAYKYDPRNPDLGSSLDYECLQAIKRAGFETDVVGPVTESLSMWERAEYWFWRQYTKLTGKKNLKFPLTLAWRSSRLLTRAAQRVQPEVIFSIFPPSFMFYSGNIPYVWYFDTTFWGLQQDWPIYGRLPLEISMWQERRALSRASRIVTSSQWSKRILVEKYRTDVDRIEVLPMPASLPESMIPLAASLSDMKMDLPLRILLVGRVYERKGIDIAIEAVTALNEQGLPAVLTVCGIDQKPQGVPEFVQFVGPYQKSDPQQLKQYVNWYQWAHLLIHPARFEPAGIVPSEAAAFGVPTLTNDTGGLATTVEHNVSGIVLPKASSASRYANEIMDLYRDPQRYARLRRTTRERYDRELNWNASGAMLADILRKAAAR